ncbi:CHAT domain-containing protein [Asanoa hainanensis]|nr:CHAT domain-containing protein [Asanoa hainanensis]
MIAASVEARLAEIGTSLFKLVFADEEARELWAGVRGVLHTVRVEVASDVDAAAMLPWELLRDPRTDRPVALEAGEYVRVNVQPAKRVAQPVAEDAERLRVLLVICRPGGGDDVPFRSVGALLLKNAAAGKVLDLTVLRPPTFAALSAVLEEAHRTGQPFHVVHFDGHGTYLPSSALHAGGGTAVGPIMYGLLSPAREGSHGYLLFEDPTTTSNQQLVDGPALGALLARTGVGVLVLNACRSAYAEAAERPRTDQTDDVHALVRGYGSLALEVSDAGVAGVVAMRYSVYVVTAAQFVADLYAALLAGRTLGGAVSTGRRQLAAQPNRSIAFDPRPLQDWSVPIVYETASVTLVNTKRDTARITVGRPEARVTDFGARGLPPGPEVGFFGRDETLLALDRAFDTHRIVLLHAYAGSGKTSTAAEFASWYAATGGLTNPGNGMHGPILFSSLEQRTPLVALLNQFGAVFDSALEDSGIQWLSLSDDERRDVALQVLAQIPVLWIWDNVEPVAGFPAGTPSAWTPREQLELRDFLRAAGRTSARMLLTSRRDEHDWLGDLPIRVRLPRMPMRERIQFTQALATRHGHRVTDVEDWRPLLQYSDGNPLAITVMVGQALRARYTAKAQIEEFVARLRAGEIDLADADEAQGRSRSLAASLTFGLEAAFTAQERAQLALLATFQNTVDVDALVGMGSEHNPWALSALAGLTREVGMDLLDRAAEIGLLTVIGSGYYSIHPALPWFFRQLQAVDAADDPGKDGRLRDAYSFAIGSLGHTYHSWYDEGRRTEAVNVLRVEEANLLHARALARATSGWSAAIGCMQGLRTLYAATGRDAEWARLVDEVKPDLIDPETGGPRSGLAEEWALLTEYQVAIAIGRRDWAAALRLQETLVAHTAQVAAAALATAKDRRTETDRHHIRNLAVSESTLGDILRDQQDRACVTHYERAAQLLRATGDRQGEGIIAFNLGHAHMDIPSLRDLDQAEQWYRRRLDLVDERDLVGRARATGQLGKVAYLRFRDARDSGNLDTEMLLGHLNAAAAAYLQVLELLPADAVPDLATTHHQLGIIYRSGGEYSIAWTHYQQAIRLREASGNRFFAGQTRHEVAVLLALSGRVGDALLYANTALDDYASYGAGAAEDFADLQSFIARLTAPAGPTATNAP